MNSYICIPVSQDLEIETWGTPDGAKSSCQRPLGALLLAKQQNGLCSARGRLLFSPHLPVVEDVALLRALLQNLFGEIVVYPGFVLEHFKVGILEQLLVVLVELLVDGLLHIGIGEHSLSGGLPSQEPVDGIAGDLVPGGS